MGSSPDDLPPGDQRHGRPGDRCERRRHRRRPLDRGGSRAGSPRQHPLRLLVRSGADFAELGSGRIRYAGRRSRPGHGRDPRRLGIAYWHDMLHGGGGLYTSGRGRWEAFDIGALRSPADMPRVAIRNDTGVAVWVDALGVESAEPSRGWSRPTLVSGRTGRGRTRCPSIPTETPWRYGPTATPFARHSGLEPPVDGRLPSTSRPAPRRARRSRWTAPGAAWLSGTGRSLSRSRSWAPTSTTAVLSSTGCRHRGPPSRPERLLGSRSGRRRGAPLAGVPEWIFGDGGRTRGTDVSHVYRRAGPYVVTVSQSDERGDVSTTTTAVRIVAPARSVRRPSITGSRKVGALLTCRRGTWAGSPPMSFKYRWRRTASRSLVRQDERIASFRATQARASRAS